MKTKLQLAALIVNFGLVFVHPYDENEYQLWKHSTLNTKNNVKAQESFIQALQMEASESQRVFNTMKNDLQKRQNTNNIKKKRSFIENTVVNKREIVTTERETVTTERERVKVRALPDDQPGCDYCDSTMIFYEHHHFYIRNRTDLNFICHEPFPKLLKYCHEMYRLFTESKNVQTEYKIIRDEDSIEKECKRRKMTFWHPSSVYKGDQHAWNVTLDVNMFHCPLTKMDLKFPRGDKPYEIRDFYITEGRNEWTVTALHNSTTSDNICVTRMSQLGRYFIRDKFGTSTPYISVVHTAAHIL